MELFIRLQNEPSYHYDLELLKVLFILLAMAFTLKQYNE